MNYGFDRFVRDGAKLTSIVQRRHHGGLPVAVVRNDVNLIANA